MLYVRYPLSLRQVEDILAERGVDICHETVRFWWQRFGPMFASEIRKKRIVQRCNATALSRQIAPDAGRFIKPLRSFVWLGFGCPGNARLPLWVKVRRSGGF